MGRYILMAGGGVLFILFEMIGLLLLFSKKKPKKVDETAPESAEPDSTVDEALPVPTLKRAKNDKKSKKGKKGKSADIEEGAKYSDVPASAPVEVPTDPEPPVNPYAAPPIIGMTAPTAGAEGAPTPSNPAPGTGVHCDAAPYLHELFSAFQKANTEDLAGCETQTLCKEHNDIVSEYAAMGLKRCTRLVNVIAQSDIETSANSDGWECVTSRVVCNVQDYILNLTTGEPVSGSETKMYEVTYLIVFIRPNTTGPYALDKINLINV